MNPSINRKREKDGRGFIQLAGYIESSAQSKENLIQRTKQSINQSTDDFHLKADKSVVKTPDGLN